MRSRGKSGWFHQIIRGWVYGFVKHIFPLFSTHWERVCVWACVCVPLSPGFFVCSSEWEGASGGKSFILTRVWRAVVYRSADVAKSFPSASAKGGDPFSCVTPISINSLEGKGGVEEGVRNERWESVSFPVTNFWIWVCERQEKQWRKGAQSRATAAQTVVEEKADHKYARLWPAGSWPTALLPCHVAAVGGGAVFPFHFLLLCHTERKRAADVWETVRGAACTGGPREVDSPIKSVGEEEPASARSKAAVWLPCW